MDFLAFLSQMEAGFIWKACVDNQVLTKRRFWWELYAAIMLQTLPIVLNLS